MDEKIKHSRRLAQKAKLRGKCYRKYTEDLKDFWCIRNRVRVEIRNYMRDEGKNYWVKGGCPDGRDCPWCSGNRQHHNNSQIAALEYELKEYLAD